MVDLEDVASVVNVNSRSFCSLQVKQHLRRLQEGERERERKKERKRERVCMKERGREGEREKGRVHMYIDAGIV
jgi:hypothetical protein